MTLPPMITDLLLPEAYPEPPGEIHLFQTHISFVIITDKYVYKIKKVVDFGFLDFTSLDKRRFYCQQELDLNRRLSPDVYLELLDIRKKRGHFLYGGEGEVVDFAVKMKRLPDEMMMINLLKAGKVDPEMLASIAETIATFHIRARTDNIIASYGSIEIIKKNWEENFSQTEKYRRKTVSDDDFKKIKQFSENFIENNHDLLEMRMSGGRIKDCHGDIHMEHVYIMDSIQIIDCIEFNDRFRYSDVAAEIAFLAMDLDFHGKRELSDSFVKSYIEHSEDDEIRRLIDFYKCYRAYVRGKVDSFELEDPALDNEEKDKVKEVAKKYFKLAVSYASS